ncbi:MAG: hypothetical protein AAFQ82_20050, partial [Myxococcota bacterium]
MMEPRSRGNTAPDERAPRILTTSRTSKLRFTGASVATKLAATLGLAILVLIGVLAAVSYRELRINAVDQVVEGLLGVTQTVAPLIPVDDHLAVAQGAGADSAAFSSMKRVLAQAAEANGLRYDQLYTFALNDDGSLRFVAMLHDKPFIGQNYHPPMELVDRVRETVTQGQAGRSEIFQDAHGAFVSAFAPIVTAGGETVGLVWADRDVSQVLETVRMRVLRAVVVELVVGVLLVALVLLLAVRLRRRLRVLVGGMRALREEDESIVLEVKGR